MAENRFSVDYGKRVCNCKKCKQKIEKGSIRLAKITANPFSEDTDMKLYFHPKCLFETFLRARASTRVIESAADIEDFVDIENDEDKKMLNALIEESNANRTSKKSNPSPNKKANKQERESESNKNSKSSPVKRVSKDNDNHVSPSKNSKLDCNSESEVNDIHLASEDVDVDDVVNRFKEFRRLVVAVANESSYLSKTELIRQKLDNKQVDLALWLRLLLPGVVDKRVYNLQSRQLIKLFSRLFSANEKQMLQDLEQGDVAATIGKFFEESNSSTKPLKKSKISMRRIDNYLAELTKITKEEQQLAVLKTLANECTANDLIVRGTMYLKFIH